MKALPCPFCGHTHAEYAFQAVIESRGTSHWFVCSYCEARGPRIFAKLVHPREPEIDALAAWNRRTEPAVTP